MPLKTTRLGARQLALVMLSGLPSTALAHAGADAASSGGSTEFWSLLSLAILAAAYMRALRYAPNPSPARALAFAGGWVVLVLAFISPVARLGGALFSVHMVQHELLMVVAAPLLVLAQPTASLLRSSPVAVRRTVAHWLAKRWMTRVWRFVRLPLAAWLIHFVVLWGWHVPSAFELALRSPAVHVLQHLSFLLAALLFWHAMLRSRAAYGPAVLYLFTTALHAGVLGALLTFAPAPWYSGYAGSEVGGLTALEDQQLGGLIMWIVGALPYLGATLVLLAGLLPEDEGRASPRRGSMRA